jgi:hypothetical protein
METSGIFKLIASCRVTPLPWLRLGSIIATSVVAQENKKTIQGRGEKALWYLLLLCFAYCE